MNVKPFAKLIPVFGAVLATMLVTGTALAAQNVTVPTNQSSDCLYGIGNIDPTIPSSCYFTDSGTGFNVQFTAVDVAYEQNGDVCLTLAPSGNTTTLQVDSQDSVTLSITQFCLKSPVSDIPPGNIAGSVDIKSITGPNFVIGPSHAGTFSGTYGSLAQSISTGDIFFSFNHFSLDLVVPVTPCTDPTGCNNTGGGQCTGPTCTAATPELDSLVLFGTGLLGGLGYVVQRRRASRRRPKPGNSSSD